MNWKGYLALTAVVVALSLFVGWLAVDLREKQDDALACGSVGRLVATAEAIVAENGEGSVYVRVGDFNSYDGDDDISLSMIIERGDAYSDEGAEVLRRAGGRRWIVEKDLEDTACEALFHVTGFVGRGIDEVDFDADRAREVHQRFDSFSAASEDAHWSFQVRTRYRNGEVLYEDVWGSFYTE